jgi:protein-disulfide isomerase
MRLPQQVVEVGVLVALAAGLLAAFLGVRAVLVASRRSEGDTADREFVAARWPLVRSGASALVDGDSTPVTVVVFGDYECPFCRLAEPVVERVSAADSSVHVAFRHFPLGTHRKAFGAAKAAICAEAQNRFPAMHRQLFSSIRWQLDTNWVREAAAAGVPDLAEFAACIGSSWPLRRLQHDISIGRAAGVVGTPAFYFRDWRYFGPLPESTLTRAARPQRD